MSNEYWKIAVEEALGEAGVSATREQREQIAESMESAANMEGEACGHYNIPHPLEAEVKTLQQKVKQEEARTDKMRSDFVANICVRRNCEPHQVHLEGDGNATIYK